MQFKTGKGFSIIELLVVIAIIGVLAALAVGAYTQNMIKSKIAEGIALLNSYSKQYQEYYALYNHFPILMADTVIATPNTQNVKEIHAGSYSSTGSGMWLYVVYQDSLGFGVNNRIILAMLGDSTTNTTSFYCGQWQTFAYVPTQYLPGGCNRTSISAIPGLVN